MTLTRGGGPLSTPHPTDVNYTIEGPKHLLFLSPFPRRLRAEIGGDTIFETERGQLLHESNLGAVLYVPREDMCAEMAATETVTHCPFKGDATHWRVNGVEDAAWSYEEPLPQALWLKGMVALYKEKVDRWFDEDEEVRGLRDPYHRCDVRRRGEELVLSETGLPNRIYVPRASVSAELERSDTTAHCPYKGDATYWHVDGEPDAAWSYEDPYDEVRLIRGHLCFAG
jgi:uncharacterized protein (DUF427 family)